MVNLILQESKEIGFVKLHSKVRQSTSTLIASTSTLWPLKDRAAYQTYINTQKLMLYDRTAYVMGDKLKMNIFFQQGDCQTPLHPAELESTKPDTPISGSYVRGHNIMSTRATAK